MDYLTTRPDIDPAHIGMMGISLGGMNTWFAAAADPRIAVAVALIGVQSFGWAIAEEKWHARVASIPYPFQAAADDFGREIIDTETVAAVMSSLCPWYHGLLKLCVCPDFLSDGVNLSTAKSAFGGHLPTC
jgi:3D (Asp-Asp-Asp) domain-containing protein